MTARYALAWLVGCVVLTACSPAPPPPPTACTPGETQSCACAGGTTGTQTCVDDGSAYGDCMECPPPAQPTCSASAPAGTCPTGQTCVAGACCAATQACGSVCCSSASLCVQDTSGNRTCAARCMTSSQCSGATNCCSPLDDDTMHALLPYGACVSPSTTGVTACRCTVGTECLSGSCGPAVTSASEPENPYICKANDCMAYDGCPGLIPSCANGYCLVNDGHGNAFCAQPCLNNGMCGTAHCAPLSPQGSCSQPGVCLP